MFLCEGLGMVAAPSVVSTWNVKFGEWLYPLPLPGSRP
jgi:hypothetical protein